MAIDRRDEPLLYNSMKKSIQQKYHEAEALRERIDEEIDQLSIDATSEDILELRNTITSNLAELAYMCSSLDDLVLSEEISSQQRWKIKVSELRRVRDEQKEQFQLNWQKLQAQEERRQWQKLVGNEEMSDMTAPRSRAQERKKLKQMDKHMDEILDEATRTLLGVQEDTTRMNQYILINGYFG
ncbi:uncharacterized protein MONOS_7524 [Monocercomonoides exilis]|uniref:uncharacterized protein n=1 Tax=Monocercomonoides exilis TaxID=2049356 RepID=UPI00355953EE|nr:hypothetical protein MONOS_7524 [Monocercomonoides exilis]|eukprot:MONOS_7524.1-p1 / transcript=MONOS_7524.1 / gene=MONOS_7524 / organism=Monocercomonoides_exilis_PA203 / gene_product=unspecified product / transcript_product=unspecified product / location=Mono_scaffold00259:28644-29485(+) / protein_length=184 / sequence_SO=supercontig / SO=protein_coding / is_pseudo=false